MNEYIYYIIKYLLNKIWIRKAFKLNKYPFKIFVK